MDWTAPVLAAMSPAAASSSLGVMTDDVSIVGSAGPTPISTTRCTGAKAASSRHDSICGANFSTWRFMNRAPAATVMVEVSSSNETARHF